MEERDFIIKNRKSFFSDEERLERYINRRFRELNEKIEVQGNDLILLIKYSEYFVSDLDIEKGNDVDLYLARLVSSPRLFYTKGRIMLPTEAYVRKWPIFNFGGKWIYRQGSISASISDLVNLSQIVADLSDFLQPTNSFQSRMENFRYKLYSQERILSGEEVERYFRHDQLRWEGYRKALKTLEKAD